jgi:hypothetical protein
VSADLIAFLNARLDEDEAAAKAWLPLVRLDGSGSWYDEVGESNLGPYSIEHARLHDPARVLREVAVRRVIIETWKDWPDYDLPPGVHEGRDDSERSRDEAVREALEAVVRALATVYDNHPDYRQEWKP